MFYCSVLLLSHFCVPKLVTMYDEIVCHPVNRLHSLMYRCTIFKKSQKTWSVLGLPHELWSFFGIRCSTGIMWINNLKIFWKTFLKAQSFCRVIYCIFNQFITESRLSKIIFVTFSETNFYLWLTLIQYSLAQGKSSTFVKIIFLKI